MKYYVIWRNEYDETNVQSFESADELEICLAEILRSNGFIDLVVRGTPVHYNIVEVATKVKVV